LGVTVKEESRRRDFSLKGKEIIDRAQPRRVTLRTRKRGKNKGTAARNKKKTNSKNSERERSEILCSRGRSDRK